MRSVKRVRFRDAFPVTAITVFAVTLYLFAGMHLRAQTRGPESARAVAVEPAASEVRR